MIDWSKKPNVDTNDIRYKLFFAMREDMGVMAEHNDSDLSLFRELKNATPDILEEYKKIFL